MFANTLQVVLTEMILRVDQREDSLHQSGPEVWQDLSETHTAPCGQISNGRAFMEKKALHQFILLTT